MDPNGTRPPIAAEQLDRLVDGLLPAADRRALLARLEAEPDGWRRCAMAYLEAQAWREALGPVARLDDRESSPGGTPRRDRPRLRLAPITLAAGLAVAAFVGGRATVDPDARPAAPLVAQPIDRPTPADPPVLRLGPDDPSVAGLGEAAGDPIETDPWAAEIQAIGYLDLPAVGPGAPVVQLPVLSGPGLDDRWLRDQPSFVPEEVRRSWRDRGYDVELQRRLVSVQLDDSGRYLTIPVDEVRLRNPARATY